MVKKKEKRREQKRVPCTTGCVASVQIKFHTRAMAQRQRENRVGGLGGGSASSSRTALVALLAHAVEITAGLVQLGFQTQDTRLV